MNRCYRLVWNRARQVLVVASEVSRGRGKSGRAVRARPLAWLAALPLSLSPMLGMAAVQVAISDAMPVPRMALPTPPVAAPIVSTTASPSGGQVTVGSGNISQSGLTTTINQHSQNLSLNWQSFNIGADSTVNFVQPNAQSIAVNRIADANGSVILGRLNANGQVFLINPNGVLFGQGAQVNVGGLVASTLDIGDGELASGTRHFGGNDSGRGSVVNRGTINAANGGYVALLGPQVTNHGTLNAPGGNVALAGGNAVTLSFDGNRLLSLQVDKSTLDALADNRQLIVADGGQVLMSAGAKDSLLASVVNNSGTIQAQTVENRAGKIVLLGGMVAGTTQVAGTLDASAPNGGNGGFIETSAAHVQVQDSARITTTAAQGKTGTWLIDPSDYTIAASGGDITGAALSANLGTSDITILSSAGMHGGTRGDVNVNDSVTWSANRLTLNAQNNININTAMHGSGNASLALEYGQGAMAAGNTSTVNVRAPVNLPAGDNFSTRQGLDGVLVNYRVITSLGDAGSVTGTDLQGINGNLSANYVLGGNIDASATAGWNMGAGFVPITDYMTMPGAMCPPDCIEIVTLPFAGIFDGLGHTISNLTINRPTETNLGLFGSIQSGAAVRNLGLIGGSISGLYEVGALAGENKGTISNSHATANVNGRSSTGGLVGRNGGTISSSHATGNINDITYADVNVISSIGGLVGFNNAVIDNSYSTGNVNGTNYMGGLVGSNEPGGMISNSYATGDVVDDYSYRGNYSNGGLVGFNTAQISTSYASGSVVNNIANGGLVGYSAGGGTISNSYWNSTANAKGIGTNNNGASTTGLSAVGMQAAANFVGFNFTSTPGAAGNNWVIVDGIGSLNNVGGPVGATRPMLASEYSTTINNAHQLQLIAMAPAASYALGSDINAANTGLGNDVWGSAGFSSIGTFSGSFDGRNHVISGITINRPDLAYRGLFAYANSSSRISNVGLVGGSVDASSYSGSLVGRSEGSINNSYATGSVNGGGNFYVGGLVGWLMPGGTISNTYATVAAASWGAGGLVGRNEGTIGNSYASGAVTGTNSGGLTGLNTSGVVINSFWNIDTTGRSASTGGTGLTTAEMMKLASFSNWNIANTGGSGAVWRIYEGHTAPLLTSFMTGLTLTGAPDATVTYNGNVQSGATISAPSGVLGAAATGTNAGFYNGYYSTQQGYDITGGNLTINPAALSAISLYGTRAYDGTTNVAAGIFTLSGLVDGEDLTLTGTGTIASKNVGSYRVNLGSLTLLDGTNGLASNYTFVGGTQTATITAATLTLGGLAAADKVYDASTTATATGTLSGVFGGDDIDATLTASFADKNAGTGKTVTVSGITLGGTDAGNYVIATGQTTTATISKLAITVDAVGTDRVYDGTTADTVDLASIGILDGDTVAFTGTGSFDDKHVGTAKHVSVSGITASGADAGNYSYNATAGTTADITPATLTYRADGSFFWTGQVPGGLGGAVTGLVGGDTLIDATDGTLIWSTPATSASPAGQYAIDGSGLSAVNYVFVQAPGNATALRVANGSAPAVVGAVVAGLQQDEVAPDSGASTLHAPDVRVVGGGVRLP